jgi:hypothetical protein
MHAGSDIWNMITVLQINASVVSQNVDVSSTYVYSNYLNSTVQLIAQGVAAGTSLYSGV